MGGRLTTWDFARTAVTRLATRMDEFAGLRDVLRVLVFGAAKHPDRKWLKQSAHEHIAHAREHASAWAAGIKRDPESGESNLAHFAVRALFALAIEGREK